MTEPDFGANLTLEAIVSPSEDPIRVARALVGLVNEAAVEVTQRTTLVRHQTSSVKALVHIREQLRDRHVRSAARRQLLLRKEGTTSSLLLNRQAAAAGVVAVCGTPEESPLGPVDLIIGSERLDEVIDWLTAYPEG